MYAFTPIASSSLTFTVGYALNNLGLAARAQGQYLRAEALLEQSLTVLPDLGEGRAAILCSLGLVALDRRQYDRAEVTFAESLRIVRTEFVGSIIRTLLKGLAGVAGVAVGRGQPQRAARLFGAADALRAAIGTPIQPVNRPRYERDVAAVRAALGEEQFKALWDEGRAMTQEQAMAFALDELPSTDDTCQPATPSPSNADGAQPLLLERPKRMSDAPASPRLSRVERQARVLEYLHTVGSLSPRAYASLLGISADTALRDLRELVNQGVVRATGTTRDRHYVLSHEADRSPIHRTVR